MAYVLLCALRRIGLPDTDFERVTCGTIRLKPLKIGALVRISARRIRIALASACPVAREWARAGSPSRRSPAPHPPDTRAAARPARGTTHRSTETRKTDVQIAHFGATDLRASGRQPPKSDYALHNPSGV
jgi:hypothetical protein